MPSNIAGAGRYKLIRRLDSAPGYEAYAALDIETSERREVLLNVYCGERAVRRMAGLYCDLDARACRDFVGLYTEEGRLTAVFALRSGAAFDAVFPPRGGPDAQERQEYAGSLMHAVLENAGMPGPLLAAMLRPDNIRADEKAHALCVNACIPPVEEGASAGETRALAALMERTLGRPWRATDEQIDWLDRAARGEFGSVGALYSAWRELAPVMERDRERGVWLTQLLRWARRSLRRAAARRRQARAQRKGAARA